MMMLPTPCLGAVISGHGDGATALATVGALLAGSNCPITWTAALDSGVVACDVVVGVIDADEGLSAGFIGTWALAKDAQVPRVLLVTTSVMGRADFGEVVAIAERALGEDPVVRFLPLASDDGMSVAALLDVLDGQILLPDGSRVPADPEHLELTADSREDLVHVVAHTILDDERLGRFLQGSPVSLPAVRSGWERALSGSDPLVPVIPGDTEAVGPVLGSLLAGVEPRWHATVESGGGVTEVEDAGVCVGIGIQRGFGRLWHCDADSACEVVNGDGQVVATISARGALACDPRIAVDATLRPPGASLVVRAPRL